MAVRHPPSKRKNKDAIHHHRTGWHARDPGRQRTYDNALAETINGLYKAELIHRCAPWRTKQAVELATLQWVAWFNNHRLLEPIGYIPPAEAEANYYRRLASQVTEVAA